MDNHNDETERFRQDLGPELEFLANGVAPIVGKLVEKAVTDRVAPIRIRAENLTRRAGTAENESLMKAFGEKHPDWKDHEAAMLGLGKKLEPKGMSSPEYLETLYALATREPRERARQEAKVADASSRATSSRPERRAPTFREAFEAAKRGERFED